MASGQMLPEKPIDMEWANLPWGDMLRREPSPEVHQHSTIHADGIGMVPAAAQIASTGLETYVKLAADISFTLGAAPAWLLVHSEFAKTKPFSRPRHASSYQIRSKEKVKKTCNSIRLGHITEKST
jgi:hypothetical protein